MRSSLVPGFRNLFKISVPLDDNYSLDHGNGANGDSSCGTIGTILQTVFVSHQFRMRQTEEVFLFLKISGYTSQEEAEILDRVKKNPYLTAKPDSKRNGDIVKKCETCYEQVAAEGDSCKRRE